MGRFLGSQIQLFTAFVFRKNYGLLSDGGERESSQPHTYNVEHTTYIDGWMRCGRVKISV